MVLGKDEVRSVLLANHRSQEINNGSDNACREARLHQRVVFIREERGDRIHREEIELEGSNKKETHENDEDAQNAVTLKDDR
ncbi:MAG: hypothetical protein EFT35_04260 [Methanophagales archaeon ANME-1-THS]|nr:MAG: hypothetical protein EFT35_04260 [Methanophagales archaeon ANME-1-THS]